MKEYIERDLLVEALEEVPFPMDMFDNTDEWKGANTARMMYAEAFRIVPAADVVEVRHGYLVSPNPYGKCSLCGMLIDIRDGFNYCPNCGARMDGGANDGKAD